MHLSAPVATLRYFLSAVTVAYVETTEIDVNEKIVGREALGRALNMLPTRFLQVQQAMLAMLQFDDVGGCKEQEL